jgi:AraC-like DNA-binding protein
VKPKEHNSSGEVQSTLARLAAALERRTSETDAFAFNTSIPGLRFYRASGPGPSVRCFYEPCVSVIVQGSKNVMFGKKTLLFTPGQFFLTSIDIPTFAQIIEGSAKKPYLALILKIDLALLRRVVAEYELPPPSAQQTQRGLAAGATTPELLDVFLRILGVLDRPAEIPVVFDLLQRELLYRLLLSQAGGWLWHAARVGNRANRLIKVIDWLKRNYQRPLRIEELAAMAGMAGSTFHHRFRDLTAVSPLQYQKSLRLYAARNLMLVDRLDASTAAMRVGYESPSQFSREYSRFFGVSPRKDIGAVTETADAG